jgi:DNA-binding response OmpR family regulator
MGAASNYLAKFFSVEELEAQMASVLREHVGGKSVVEWQMGDSSAKKLQWMSLPPSVRMQDIGQALSIKDPVTYPPETFIPITQTRPTFS